MIMHNHKLYKNVHNIELRDFYCRNINRKQKSVQFCVYTAALRAGSLIADVIFRKKSF